MSKETWCDHYDKALDDGEDIFEAARLADVATREETIDRIESAELYLSDR